MNGEFTLSLKEEARALGAAIKEVDAIREKARLTGNLRASAIDVLRIGQLYGYMLESGKGNSSIQGILLRGADMGRYACKRFGDVSDDDEVSP